MTESPAVHATATEQLSRGVRSLRFDLRHCTTLDSTFLGTLLSLGRQLATLGGNVVLVSPSPRVLEQLREMGLEDFYAIEQADPWTGPSREIAAGRPGADALQRRVLDAHEELARVPGAGAGQFGPVVEELHRDAQSPSGPSSKDPSRPSSSNLN